MKDLFNFILGGASLIVILVLLSYRIFCAISFSMDCTQYLKRAADANTIELAKDNLSLAIKYLEEKHLTNGVVSIFLKQPKNDIGFWYSNLRASQEELNKVTAETTQLEKSNILMKLRETLTDNSKDGIKITCPQGISIYPRNKPCFYLLIIMGVYVVSAALRFFWRLSDY